jgi:hypothetical protein
MSLPVTIKCHINFNLAKANYPRSPAILHHSQCSVQSLNYHFHRTIVIVNAPKQYRFNSQNTGRLGVTKITI